MYEKDLQNIVAQFQTEGAITEIKPLGSGLINTTYKVTTQEENAPDYVLQHINNDIFQNVDMLMDNIVAVTSHIRKKLEAENANDLDRKVLNFLPCKDQGKYYYKAEDGKYWRLMRFIPNSICKDNVTPKTSYEVGIAFGNFQAMLADIPTPLGETIPNFHNMEFRMMQLKEAVAGNKAGRLGKVQNIVDGIMADAEEMCKGERLFREGKLPKRICHCDTKVNNILFDQDGSILLVIDLDTVMPNFVFSDIGDFLRNAANTTAEDDPDTNHVSFNMDIFKAFVKGYIESAKSFLKPIEIENIPYAAKLFPFMQTVRFLADYLDGDTYYRTKYKEHNYDRTLNQWTLYLAAKAAEEEMAEYVNSLN